MPYVEINVTIELFCCILLLILISSVIVKKQKGKSDYLFLAVLILNLLVITGDMTAWIFDNYSGMLPHMMSSVANFLSYFCTPLTYVAFLGYIYAGVTHEKPYGIETAGIALVCVLCFVLMAVIVLNLFNGMIYRLDENNVLFMGYMAFFPKLDRHT